LHLLDPMSYIEFLALESRAEVVITDSGGIQEETTFLGIPCLTMRSSTERPITVTCGTNILVGNDPAKLLSELAKILSGKGKKGVIPPLWDGRTADRIVDIVERR
jgi:UDP-N-acetylglucosamine 2-epimerase (non-hydrolysing)